MKLLSRYLPSYVRSLTYMLQASDYRVGDYLAWHARTSDFKRVSHRGSLVFTVKAKLVYSLHAFLYIFLLVLALLLCGLGIAGHEYGLVVTGVIVFVAMPWLLVYTPIPLLWAGEKLIQAPKKRERVLRAAKIVEAHPAYKIAVAGSYGKTTFKETLNTVLAEGKRVAATPGNLNTPLGTAVFVDQLKGDEEIIVFELGESHVGDVAELCDITQPDMGVITGINQAHLETFGSLENTVATIFELADYLQDKPVYKNIDSDLVAEHIEPKDPLAYSQAGVHGWKISDIESDISGIRFTAEKNDKKLRINSGLLGEHQIGPLIACIDIADDLGLSGEQIENGIAKTAAFEHRMQPRLVGGAWVIDDTYNGNLQGVEVGLKFLTGLEASRKIYVTPGLVEQGDETELVHKRIGGLAAQCDVVVLMQNSTTKYIREGLEQAGFSGELQVVVDPLQFYINLDSFVAAGDVLLMQNDWTDNYA